MSDKRWKDDAIQFPRLLCEISMTQEKLDIDALCESMDLSQDEVNELFERAHRVWEQTKKEVLGE